MGIKNSLRITNIQRLSVHDGPGIRTTVFLKGCSLHCFWCHNPETISSEMELEFLKDQCIGCEECKRACSCGLHYQMPGCTGCFACAEACPTQALHNVSKDWENELLLDTLIRDATYYNESGGGVTFSGGEPFLQWEGLQGVLPSLGSKGVHIAVDTAGNVPWKNIEPVVNEIDLFLYDIKSSDADKHKKATGVSNTVILDNFHKLCALKKRIWIRVPLIPGFNCTEKDIYGFAKIIEGCESVEKLELLPFHRLGEGKYNSMNKDYLAKDISPPSNVQIEAFKQIFREYNLPVF